MVEWYEALDLWQKIGFSFVAAGLSFGTFAIAYMQARTASDKLKLDLFERRHNVYFALVNWMDDLQSRHVPDKEYTAQMREIESVDFLFGKEVKIWFKSLRKKAREMNSARKRLKEIEGSHPNEQQHQMIMKDNETYSRLTLDMDHEIERAVSLFAPYMYFGNRR